MPVEPPSLANGNQAGDPQAAQRIANGNQALDEGQDARTTLLLLQQSPSQHQQTDLDASQLLPEQLHSADKVLALARRFSGQITWERL
jgi:hypothetical protein